MLVAKLYYHLYIYPRLDWYMTSLVNKIHEMHVNATKNPVDAVKEFMDNCKKIGGEVVAYNYEAGDELFAVCELHGTNEKSARITLTVDPSTALTIVRTNLEDDSSNNDNVTQIDSYGDVVCKFAEHAHGIHPDEYDTDIEPKVSRVSRSVVCTTNNETISLLVDYDYNNPSDSMISTEYTNLRTHGKSETIFEL